jgi:chorismate dehydratase
MSTLSPLHRQTQDKITPDNFRLPSIAIPDSVRVGSVPYLNAKPLTRDICSPIAKLEPSRLAADLRAGHLDVGLVPVMEVLEAPAGTYRVAHSVAIGSQRSVYSVYLNYTGALGRIETVALDPASKTSVELTRIVLEKFHRLKPRYVSPDEPADAQLLIGDPAIIHRQAHPEQNYLDLGEEWRAQTQLPFVFAVWASLNLIARNAFERLYLSEHLCYDLGAPQKKAIARFAELLRELERIPTIPKITYI